MSKKRFSFSPSHKAITFQFLLDVCMLQQIESLSGFWSTIAISWNKAEYGSTAFYERAAELL